MRLIWKKHKIRQDEKYDLITGYTDIKMIEYF